jgi:hypothetical protein
MIMASLYRSIRRFLSGGILLAGFAVATAPGVGTAGDGGTWGDNPTVSILPGPLCNGTWGGNPEVVVSVGQGAAVQLKTIGADTASAVATCEGGLIKKVTLRFDVPLVIDASFQGHAVALILEADPLEIVLENPVPPGDDLYILDLDPLTDPAILASFQRGYRVVKHEAAWTAQASWIRWDGGPSSVSAATSSHR